MTTFTTSNGSALLKVLYPEGVEEIWFEESPLAAWLPKKTDFVGVNKQINTIISGITGSTDFATALNNVSTPELPAFNVTRKKNYVIGSIENEMMAASKGDRAAIAEAVKTKLDAALYTFGRSTAHQAWGNGGGSLGKGLSSATDQITLDSVYDAIKFEVGMKLQTSSADGLTGTVEAGTGTVKSITRDATTAKVTLTANVGTATGLPNFTANDHLFREGDFNNCLNGVLSWVPVTAPASGDAAFFGVDRSKDVERLSGSRFTGTGSLEDQIFDAEAHGVGNGGKFDSMWLHTKRFAELKKIIQARAWYPMERVQTKAIKSNGQKSQVGVHGFVFPGENGPISVMSDANAPYSYGLLTRRDIWSLDSLGEAPHFDEQSGNKFLVESSADGKQFRLKAYWNLCCKRPLDNVLITWV